MEIEKFVFHQTPVENVYFPYLISKKYGIVSLYYADDYFFAITKSLLCRKINPKFTDSSLKKICPYLFKYFTRMNLFKIHCRPGIKSLDECTFHWKRSDHEIYAICVIKCAIENIGMN